MVSPSRIRRFLAVLALVAMTPLGYAATVCSGWSASAAERMACCRSMGNHCAAVSADDCCAHGETRQNLETMTAIAISPGDGISERVVPPAHPSPSLRVALRPISERPETYLLDSVFLI